MTLLFLLYTSRQRDFRRTNRKSPVPAEQWTGQAHRSAPEKSTSPHHPSARSGRTKSMVRYIRSLAVVLCIVSGCIGLAYPAAASSPAANPDDAGLWAAIRSGAAFAMMRHAYAPGTGDPANFTLGDCTTQRNLDARGRRQAAETGERFRRNGIDRADVLTSQWCRCRETAALLDLGTVTDLPPLNSFFGNRDRGPAQTEALRDWLSKRDSSVPLVLVTHQVNITALTGIYPRSGEIVVARRSAEGGIEVLGRIRTPAG